MYEQIKEPAQKQHNDKLDSFSYMYAERTVCSLNH